MAMKTQDHGVRCTAEIAVAVSAAAPVSAGLGGVSGWEVLS